MQAGITVGRMRRIAVDVPRIDPCDPFVIHDMPEWSGLVRRFNRFRIEREGVNKFLTRNWSSTSQCKSGRWDYDGATLSFRGTLPPLPSRVVIIPLTYRVTK
jgi:hypothetical protein